MGDVNQRAAQSVRRANGGRAVDVSWYPACGDELAAADGNSIRIGYLPGNTGLRIPMRICSRCRRAAGDLILPVSNWRRAIWGVRSYRQPFYRRSFCASERMYRTGDVARWLIPARWSTRGAATSPAQNSKSTY